MVAQIPRHGLHGPGRVILNHLLHLVDKDGVPDLPVGALLPGCPLDGGINIPGVL
uniref:Uncharacterized protein n=1 Tax=Lepeophtheirus salmonis TaxID=72036 RepID=A0A0K2VKV3_LEPSM